MTRQGQNFVIPARWIKVGAAIIAVGSLLGPALGVGVAYVVRDVLDRPQRGVATLSATAEPGAAADLVVLAPQPVTPVPERTRPELERLRLLHGLAGT